jgi:alanyl-tRNA synthetase
LKTDRQHLSERVLQLLEEQQRQSQSLLELKQQIVSHSTLQLLSQVQTVEGIKVLAVQIASIEREMMRVALDELKQKLGVKAAILLASVEGNAVRLIAGVGAQCISYFSAVDLLRHVAEQLGGRGGGRPDMAQGGGDKPEHLDQALASVLAWVKGKLKS